MNFIDNLLNNITMYRLVLYYLIFLLMASLVLSFFNILPFNPLALIFSVLFITGVCWVTNTIFAKTFEAPTNVESVYISALILSLIITPIRSSHDIPFLFWAGVLTMSSKFILSFNKKHFFNPAALAVTLTSFTIGASASWWIGTLSMLPFVMSGILIVSKIRKFNLVFYFLITALIVITGFSFVNGNDPFATIAKSIFYSPLLFFAFVMLTEPLTIPSTKSSQSFYAGFVGFLFAPQIHIGSFFTTPEIALVLGNIFSYLVRSKVELIISLVLSSFFLTNLLFPL